MARGFHLFDWRAVYRVALIHISNLVIVIKRIGDGGQAVPVRRLFAVCVCSTGVQSAGV